jgi:hypothetical protein
MDELGNVAEIGGTSKPLWNFIEARVGVPPDGL